MVVQVMPSLDDAGTAPASPAAKWMTSGFASVVTGRPVLSVAVIETTVEPAEIAPIPGKVAVAGLATSVTSVVNVPGSQASAAVLPAATSVPPAVAATSASPAGGLNEPEEPDPPLEIEGP